MAYLPGNFEENVSEVGWTRAQMASYLSLYYLLIAMYVFLVALALRNVWVILVR